MATRDMFRMADAIATDRLGLPLVDWMADAADAGVSWRRMGEHLSAATDGVLDFHWTTLYGWHRQHGAAA